MRVNRARERGFLPALRVMVNPLLFKCREANLHLEVRDEKHKDEAISKIRSWMEFTLSSIFVAKKLWF